MAAVNPWNADVPKSFDSIWLNSQDVIRWIQQKTSHDPSLHWLRYAIKTYFGPALSSPGHPIDRPKHRCLILGANEGWMERLLCESGFTGEIIASDIADKALARAESRAKERGYNNIKYVLADLNEYKFQGPFDFIIAEGVLHHIVEVERCLRMLSDSLAPGGLLFAAEYEGPVRFQLPEMQVRWINAALNLLPRGLRPLHAQSDETLPASAEENSRCFYVAPTAQSIADSDPSEAINGPMLKQLIPQIFDVVERNPFGGTLLAYMTQHFDFARANTDEFTGQWLKVLMHIEDTVIETGILQSDYVFYVLRKK
jgi:2-polyprenyl-3-methyl-5-hydroxy-6-metoxy-1,4-benzoquinol methylase